jgi:predicted ester cyclase
VSSEEEKNKALARRFMEARAKVDLNAIELMMATDLISHGLLPGQQPGREGLKRSIAEIAATFSNRRRFIEDQVAEADKVVTRYTLGATHDRKEIMGAAPTGREVTYKAIVIHRISGGKIAEEWGLGTADQFGPIPSLGDAEEMQVFTVPAPEAAG